MLSDNSTLPNRSSSLLKAFRELGGIAGLALRAVLSAAEPWAANRLATIIVGMSGTGKELVARAIHNVFRPKAPLIPVNCSEITPSLLASELFGHKKGSFSGAYTDHKGLLAEVRTGILFLDELQDAPLEVQTKILRVVEYRKYRPVGSVKEEQFDGRIICATNRPVTELVAEGVLRKDLFYRLHGAEITLPTLCQQPDILDDAFSQFVRNFAREVEKSCPAVDVNQISSILASHSWPGNFRELNNVAKQAFCIADCNGVPIDGQLVSRLIEIVDDYPPLNRKARGLSRSEIVQALAESGGKVSAATRALKVPRQTLKDLLVEHGIPHVIRLSGPKFTNFVDSTDADHGDRDLAV